MSKTLKYTFLVHAVVGLIVGAPLLIKPGGFLGALGWAPVDPILSRMLGAALLALAYSSLRGYLAKERAQVLVLIEMEAIFCILGAIGLLRHLLFAHYPAIVWLDFIVLAAFAVAWVYAWVKK